MQRSHWPRAAAAVEVIEDGHVRGRMGGMEELVKAAEAEGALNVIAVPPEWANYKGVLEKFKAKYPKIKVDEQGLDFNSQQEIDAAQQPEGHGQGA